MQCLAKYNHPALREVLEKKKMFSCLLDNFQICFWKNIFVYYNHIIVVTSSFHVCYVIWQRTSRSIFFYNLSTIFRITIKKNGKSIAKNVYRDRESPASSIFRQFVRTYTTLYRTRTDIVIPFTVSSCTFTLLTLVCLTRAVFQCLNISKRW